MHLSDILALNGALGWPHGVLVWLHSARVDA